MLYIIFVQIRNYNKQKLLVNYAQKLERVEKESSLMLDLIKKSNEFVGYQINRDIYLSNYSDTVMISELLHDSINIVYEFSNTTCIDCLKEQVQFLGEIKSKKDCIALTHFDNTKELRIFLKNENIKFPVYNLRNGTLLFENEDNSIPKIMIIDNELKLLGLYHCNSITIKEICGFLP